MAVDYFADFRDFGLTIPAGQTAAAARTGLIATLASYGVKVPAIELSDEQLGVMPAHVLLAWLHDADLSLSLFAIPKDALTDALRAALERVSGRSYGYEEVSMGDDRARAFARIDAALGVADFDEYAEELGHAVDASERRVVRPHRVGYLEHGKEPIFEPGAFDRRFVAAYSVRRSQ